MHKTSSKNKDTAIGVGEAAILSSKACSQKLYYVLLMLTPLGETLTHHLTACKQDTCLDHQKSEHQEQCRLQASPAYLRGWQQWSPDASKSLTSPGYLP